MDLGEHEFPFSRGCSFYEVNDNGLIIAARDIVESTIKPGGAALYVSPPNSLLNNGRVEEQVRIFLQRGELLPATKGVLEACRRRGVLPAEATASPTPLLS